MRYSHSVFKEPLSPANAKPLIRAILDGGVYVFSRHAGLEMAKDDLAPADCLNALRAGNVRPAEYEGTSWRYRVQTYHITVVIAFRSSNELVVITAWRIKPRR